MIKDNVLPNVYVGKGTYYIDFFYGDYALDNFIGGVNLGVNNV
jgi:hypothetical protein